MAKTIFIGAIVWLCLHVPCYAQAGLLDQKVSLRYQALPLGEVLQDITKRYGTPFSYSKDLLPVQQPFTLAVENRPLGEALEMLFRGKGIDFRLMGEQIVLKQTENQTSGPLLIRGTVADKSSGEPLTAASVSLVGKALGTITNPEGAFSLKIPPADGHGRIAISYLGYEPHYIAISDFGTKPLKIELVPVTHQLDEVVVQEKTALSILEEATARISQNYDTAAVQYTYYMKDETRQDDEPIQVTEAVYQAGKGRKDGQLLRQVELVKGRRSKRYSAYEKILSTFIHLTGFEVGNSGEAIFYLDYVNGQNENGLLGTKGRQYHQFELLGLSQYNGREVYVIAFDQKDKYKNKSLLKGKLYIESSSLAFLRIEAERSPKGIKHAPFMGASRAVARLLGFGESRLLSDKVEINYRPLHGKWYLSSIQSSTRLYLRKSKRDFEATVSYKGELAVTDIQKDSAATLATSGAGNFEDLSSRRFRKYDEQFWGRQNIIEPDAAFEEAFAAIAQKNKEEKFNRKFWDRYKVYKVSEDPADSVSLPKRDAGELLPKNGPDSQPEKLPGGNGNIMMKAKYAPLSRSLYTPHFIYYYSPADSSGALQIAQVLEAAYSRILGDLGVKTHPQTTVEIYPHTQAYHFAIGRDGAADSDIGVAVANDAFKIVSPRNPGNYHSPESILKAAVHEFAHCVHYNLLMQAGGTEVENLNPEEAPWLFEALACYESDMFYEPGKFAYLREGKYPTLEELNQVETSGKIYDLGYLLIEYIKLTWGREALLKLLKTNGNIAASLKISSESFEKGFYVHLKAKYKL